MDSDVGKALLACDDSGPTIMMIVNMVLDPAAGPVAIGDYSLEQSKMDRLFKS